MRSVLVGLAASMLMGAAPAATSPSEPIAELTEPTPEALYTGLEAELGAICPTEALEPYFDALSQRTSGAPLEVVIEVLGRLTAEETLCPYAREAARQASELAQFALASTDDATGAIGATTNAPFGFGGAPPPGGAGYL